MIPKLQITVQHIDGISGTYPVTPWIIDQWEQMAKTSFMRTFAGIENAEVGHLNLLAFLAERQAGVPVESWREAFVKTLDTIPSVEVIEDPKEAAGSSDASSPS